MISQKTTELFSLRSSPPWSSSPSSFVLFQNKNHPRSDGFVLAGAEGHACFTGYVLGDRCFATVPASDFGAKNNSPNCFLHAPHPLGLQVLILLYFFTNKKPPYWVVSCLWQGQKDLNPRHAVLETAALPTELYPYIKLVGHQGLEPRTDRL